MKGQILFFLFIFFGKASFSQINFNFVEAPKPQLFFDGSVNKIPVSSFLNAPQFSFEQNNNLHYFHYEIPKGAIFCRMENSLRNKFNIWIKIRAGTDESYNEIKPQ